MTLSSEALVALALPLLTACSTITSGTTQEVSFHSSSKDTVVAHEDRQGTLFLDPLSRFMQASEEAILLDSFEKHLLLANHSYQSR